MFVPTPGEKYEQPVVFGPTAFPDRTEWGRVDMITLSWVTTREAAEALVPYHFRVLDPPVVSMSRATYTDVDYLGGRGYNELTVGIKAAHDGTDAITEGLSMPVLWVDDVAPILAGRELAGYPKIGGQLPPVHHADHGCSFTVSEYDTVIIDGGVDNMQPLDEEKLARLNHATSSTIVLGWKYVPGSDDVPDVDYPTEITLDFSFDEGWVGDGHVAFHPCDEKDAPFSSRIIDVLRAVPVLETRRAFVGSGSGFIDRTATRRLR